MDDLIPIGRFARLALPVTDPPLGTGRWRRSPPGLIGEADDRQLIEQDLATLPIW